MRKKINVKLRDKLVNQLCTYGKVSREAILKVSSIQSFRRYCENTLGKLPYSIERGYYILPKTSNEHQAVADKLEPQTRVCVKAYTTATKGVYVCQGLSSSEIQRKVSAMPLRNYFMKELGKLGYTAESQSRNYNNQCFQSTQALQ